MNLTPYKEESIMKNKVDSFINSNLGPFLYIVVGLVMAVPYTYLAGWDKNYVFFVALALPIVTVVLYVLRGMPQRFLKDFPVFRKGFWAIVLYCLLPIFSNGVSIFLKWAGIAMIGDMVFRYRYTSLVLVPLALFIGWIILEDIREWRGCMRRWRARNFLRKTGYLRSAVAEPVDEAGKHCGPKILEEYAEGKPLPTWVLEDISRHIEVCGQCRRKVGERHHLSAS